MTALPPGLSDVRFFDLEEANRQLPLVRRIVADIMSAYRTDQRDEVQALVDELHELGCHFKGFEGGLVDWYSYYAGRPVFLCWKQGEEMIEFWHQTDAGFRGRQPILPGQEDAFKSEPPGEVADDE
jgi:hypothetical protein